MSFANYCWAVLKKSIEAPWKLVDTIAGVLGIIGAFLTWLLPQIAAYVQLANWIVPVALFAPLFLFRVALSPYWLIVDEKKSSQDIRSRLKLIEESQPNIVFHSVRDAQLFRDSNISQGKKRPIYRVLQVWFKNSPAISNEQSMAKSVTSIIEFKNKARSSSIVKVYGVWAVENPPDFVGSAKSSSSVDILPGNLPVKLNIAIKFISEASAYAFSLESFTRDPDGRDTSYEIPPGNYEMVIYLNGVGVNEKFIFDLRNLGENENIILEPLQEIKATT
jgi:hypothetical protein